MVAMNNEPDKKHILVVDDDAGIRDLLGQFLQKHDYAISLAKNGDEMWQQLKAHSINLVILDVMMPGKDGVELCKELRQESHLPVIMLTAMCEDVDRIIGLEMGADDYIGKPFNPRELLARVKAILRRAEMHTESQEKAQPVKKLNAQRYDFAGWQLNRVERRLLSPNSDEVGLSSGEYNLLLVFLQRPQQVLSRDQLLDLTRNRQAGPYDRSIDIQISRLRHKIEMDHKDPKIIKTVRGGGYVLATDVEMA